ncbi:uncharacterized protein [Coffea arabica]|uniref:Endonuclease/exonuclease/phosphatase domain-containing protein n=1 Tax=Coffea arabica TaxID=13443 RepID=A0ABM4W1R4_COFAR
MVWNCRGLGNPCAIRALNKLLRDQAPSLVFLSETKLLTGEMDVVRRRVGFENGFSIDCRNRGGGLALLWRVGVELSIVSYSVGHIDAVIKDSVMGQHWRFIGFYGPPKLSQRKHSRQLLRRLASLYSLPWLCVGDFNEILSSEEKCGGTIRTQTQMDAFREALGGASFYDLGFRGSRYTWARGRSPTRRICERLGRAVASPEWSSLFPASMVRHLSSSWSDHVPICISIKHTLNAFNNKKRRGDPVASLVSCAQQALTALQSWGRRKLGHLKGRIKKLFDKLETIQFNSSHHLTEELAIKKELDSLLEQEELYWKQRLRVSWLQEGD